MSLDKKALRRMLRERSQALRATVAQLPAVKAAKKKRRLRQSAVMFALALLLFFIRCDCGVPELATGGDAGIDSGVVQAVPIVKPKRSPAPVKPKPLTAKVALDARDGFGTSERTSPDWLDGFRLQVAARSPRLAECFKGTERPGALRWSTSLNPESGAVSDQLLEPLGAAIDLNKTQQSCLRTVLGNPPYRLMPAQLAQPVQGLPSRVSIVIEF